MTVETPTIHMVDVFGAAEFRGNPVAVVAGADDLATEQMQTITRWFNLSETTFLLPPTHPEADYRVRIFTLDREMPFAGHPTLGTCHVWRELGGTPRNGATVIQECGAGLVQVREDTGGLLAFAAPPLLRSGAPTPDELADVCEFLGLETTEVVDAAWIDNGPGWLGVRLGSAGAVLALEPARQWPRRLGVGVVGPHPSGHPSALEVRAFFSDHRGGILEDPITGSLNASIAQWLLATGVVDGGYAATQGTCIGADGRVTVSVDADGQVWVGGRTHAHVTGALEL